MLRSVWTPGDATALARVFLPEPRARARAVLPIALAVIAHGAVAVAVPGHRISPPAADPPPTQMIELVPPPPPPAPEPPPPVKPPPAPEPPPPPAQIRTAQPRSQPPAPAQAAAVVTQKEDPAGPADFTDSMVVGDATTYAGGTTSATGTTVRKVEVAGKSSGGAPAAEPGPAPGSPDRSRRARLAGDATWACDFPREADAAQIDHAVVTLRIAVDIQGAVNSVTIVTDPGSGFGREARTCAMLKRFEPALNRDGQPVAGTSLVNVRFDR